MNNLAVKGLKIKICKCEVSNSADMSYFQPLGSDYNLKSMEIFNLALIFAFKGLWFNGFQPWSRISFYVLSLEMQDAFLPKVAVMYKKQSVRSHLLNHLQRNCVFNHISVWPWKKCCDIVPRFY